MAFTPPPIPPNSGDPANFNGRADAFLGWFPGFVAELNQAGYPELPSRALVAGTAATPTWTWDADPDTGVYRPGDNQWAIATGGMQRLLISNTALTASVQIQAIAGTAPAPAYSAIGDTNTGMFFPLADTIAWGTGGVERLRLSTNGLMALRGASMRRVLDASDVQANSNDVSSPDLITRVDGVNSARLSAYGEYFSATANRNIDNEPAGSVALYGNGNPGTFPPGNSAFWWITTQRTYVGSNRVQEATSYSGTDTPTPQGTERYFRISSSSGSWGPWLKLLNSADLNGAVNNGAIFERGTNANGDYVKFADGTMICTHSRSETLTSGAVGPLHRSTVPEWIFPAAFSAVPVVTAQVQGSATWGNPGAASITRILEAVLWSTSTFSASVVIARYVAIGRWR